MRRLVLPIAAVLVFMARPAFGWHEPGHMITALVAYEQLDDAARQRLVKILEKHPRFHDDFEAAMPPGLDDEQRAKWLFCRASIWPDLVRGGNRRDPHVPADPARMKSYSRTSWHFIDEPFVLLAAGATAADRQALLDEAKKGLNLEEQPPQQESLGMNALQAIAFNADRLKNGNDADKAVALCWLIHVIGDLHQPLHSAALFTRSLISPADNPDGDRGGNSIKLRKADDEAPDNLHSLWDDAPNNFNRIAQSEMFDRVQELTDDLLVQVALTDAGKRAAEKTKPADWAAESLALAQRYVYAQSLRRQILEAERDEVRLDTLRVKLPEGYFQRAKAVADRRVVEGGFRLAELLK